MTLVAVAVAAALLCWPARRRPADRLRLTIASTPASRPDPVGLRRPFVVAAALALVALLLVGAPWWIVVALTVIAFRGGRRPAVEPVVNDEIPTLADLMAACLSAGATVSDALEASLVAAGPWLRARGQPVVAALRAGEEPERAWQLWVDHPQLAPVARTCMRTAGSGATAASELSRVAARLRAGQRAARQQRVARASVWIVLPLGTCFLPAFVALGVVPLVVSLIERLH